MEFGPVQCDGDCERPADGPLWGQHPELHTGPDSGPGPLPQQGLWASPALDHLFITSAPDLAAYSCVCVSMFQTSPGSA